MSWHRTASSPRPVQNADYPKLFLFALGCVQRPTHAAVHSFTSQGLPRGPFHYGQPRLGEARAIRMEAQASWNFLMVKFIGRGPQAGGGGGERGIDTWSGSAVETSRISSSYMPCRGGGEINMV